MVPHEVFIMYKHQWESSVREGKNREEIDRKGGKVSAADYLSKRNKIELCKNVVEMLPTKNVRILREVLGVVRVVCLLWRPWEIGRRSIRKGDNTLDNILPRFARMLITGEDINGEKISFVFNYFIFFSIILPVRENKKCSLRSFLYSFPWSSVLSSPFSSPFQ